MKTTTKLRELIHTVPMVVAPFILNAMHAKIAEAVGFRAVYMTGAGTAAERGFPDVGLLTMSEMVAHARYIADAVQIPVICDADTGYGNHLNVQRTVREYERAGVAAIHLEDQVFPKKCGFFDVMRVSQPLTFADAPVCAIEPPSGFEALTTALSERCAITIIYDSESRRPGPRVITPRLVLEVHGVAYVIAHCHLSDAERTFRLDRIREYWLE